MNRIVTLGCWSVCLALLAGCDRPSTPGPQENETMERRAESGGEFIRVDVQGTLQHGVMAIGAETTGTTITARGITWELDLQQDASLAARAEQLSEKQARVRGTLERREGVEIPQRWIVTVETLEAVEASTYE